MGFKGMKTIEMLSEDIEDLEAQLKKTQKKLALERIENLFIRLEFEKSVEVILFYGHEYNYEKGAMGGEVGKPSIINYWILEDGGQRAREFLTKHKIEPSGNSG